MTNADPAAFTSANFARPVDSLASRAAAQPEPFRLTPDMINGLVVIGGSVAMALAGIGLGGWMQLPFGG